MTLNQKARIKNNKYKQQLFYRIKARRAWNKYLGQPQIKGLTLKIYTMTPKKPNSALRKVTKVKLNSNKIITAYIPGEKHSLSVHNLVLIRPGKSQDLPGIKYKVIRGVLDCK